MRTIAMAAVLVLCMTMGYAGAQYVGIPKTFQPSLNAAVKRVRVKNPPLVLAPEARRMSHFLDAEQDWIFTNTDGEVIDEEEETEGEEEIEATPEEDPYFVRDAAGRRLKKIPDIAKFLPEKS